MSEQKRNKFAMLHSENTIAARALIRILQYDGLWNWPINANRHPLYRFLRRWHFLLLHIPITFTYVFLMAVQFIISTNFDEAANQLPMLITELAMLIKFQFIFRHRDKAYALIMQLNENPIFRLRKSERDFWLKKHHIFANIANFYMGCSFMVCLISISNILRPYNYELAFPFYVVFDWHNPRACWLVYIYQAVSLALTCITNISMDMMTCYYMFHFTLLYKLIGMRMKNLKHLEELEVVNELRNILSLHQVVRKMTKMVEFLISLPVLSQILLNAFVLCFTIYYLHSIPLEGNASTFISMIQFINVISLQIYLSCHYANKLTEASESLLNCLYDCHWEERSVSTRKIIYLYMEFLKMPVQLKAGNFFVVGLPIFCKTMNNAYSLCAVLLNKKE